MEGRGHHSSLPDGDRITAFSGDHFDAGADALDFGGADEDHFCGFAAELALADRAVNLQAVGVAANGNIKHAQPFLRGILDFMGQQNCASAGAECRLGANELLELLESGLAQEFEKRAGLAAGDDQAVDLVELLGPFDEHNFSTQLFEPFAVRVKVALEGKNTNGNEYQLLAIS